MTNLVNAHGQRGAVEEMQRIAKDTRPIVLDLLDEDFTLDSNIQLKSQASNAKNYEKGTVAWEALPTNGLPDDSSMHALLEALLAAYELIIDEDPVKSPQPIVEPAVMEPYTIDDALNELFLEREEVERYLDIWGSKKEPHFARSPRSWKVFSSQASCLCVVLVVAERQEAGLPAPAELLAHTSPLGWAHILLTGEYRWPLK